MDEKTLQAIAVAFAMFLVLEHDEEFTVAHRKALTLMGEVEAIMNGNHPYIVIGG